tara:strand:+ start:362 stop:577 length:216 start_codon:yes stop_codon:yes gene_type:complete
MKIGDLVEYIGSHTYAERERQLGTIVRFRDAAPKEICNKVHGEYYIIWHTANNEGWWSGQCLRVVSSNENR